MKNEKGITLIALVITIIVLLILAGISIAMLTGDNGLLTKSKQSAAASAVAGAKDEVTLEFQKQMAEYLRLKYTATTSAQALEDAIPTPTSIVGQLTGKFHDCSITAHEPTGSSTEGTIVIAYPASGTADYTITGTIDTDPETLSLEW